MLAKFQAHYPTANLISELLQIYQGKFVVRVEVQVDSVTRATGLAAAETLELAEDRARSRVLMVLLPDASSSVQPELLARHLSGISEVKPDVKASLPLAGTDNKHTGAFVNSPTSSFAALPTAEKATLTPSGLPKLAMENNNNPVLVNPVAHAEVTGEPNGQMYNLQPESNSESMIPFGDEEPTDSSDYSYEENTELEPQVVAKVKKPVNMSQAFAQTTTELKRLDWNTQEGRNYLKQKYGKTSRQQLTDDELLEFLTHLKSQPTPNRLPIE